MQQISKSGRQVFASACWSNNLDLSTTGFVGQVGGVTCGLYRGLVCGCYQWGEPLNAAPRPVIGRFVPDGE